MPVPGGTWTWERHEDHFDRGIEWLLVLLLAFMPFTYGAVEAWSEEVVIALTASVSVCFLLKMAVTRAAPLTWTWAYIPVAAFIIVAAVQLAPLPVWLTRVISPNTVAQKSELLRDLDSAGAPLKSVAISFYPYATRHDLRLVLAVAAVFAVVINVFRRPEQISRLLRAIVAIGTAVFVLALAQDIFGSDRIYGVGPIVGGGARSGPFIHHSHYAQFANLCIGAALGLICMNIHRAFARRPVTLTSIAEYLGSPDAKSVWVLAAITMIGAATVFLSLSRGGMISMMIAGAFTTLVLNAGKSLRGAGWMMAVMGLGAFLCVLYIGLDAVYDRLGTLGRMSELQGSRREILRDVAGAWVKFPLVGTGLGTHEVVYPMFDRSTVPALAAHAENEYAQVAEETGAAGFLALATFGVIVWRSYAQAIRPLRVPVQSAAYGLGFGLMAILVHSLADFGQHLPANAFLSATFCALILRLPQLAQREAIALSGISVAHKRTSRAGLLGLAVVAVVWGWALLDADAARRGEAFWAKVVPVERSLMERSWQGSDREYVELLSDAISAQERQPNNIKYRHWLNVYRWYAISGVMSPRMQKSAVPPQGVEFAARIAADLRQGLKACPTFGPSWCVLGQLERMVLGREEEGSRHIKRGRELAPCDPTACFVSGLVHAEDGDAEAAFREWQRAAQLDERLFREAALLFVGPLSRPELSCRLAGGDPSRLLELESILRDARGHPEPLREVRANLVRLLERDCRRDGSPAWKFARLAQVYREDGRRNEAIRMYRRALALSCGDVDWRLALAQLLAEAGALDQAAREARICLQARPDDAAARNLFESLSVRLHTAQLPGPAPRTRARTREE